MVQRSVIFLMLMIVFIGCGEDEPEKVKPKEVFDEKEVVDEEPKKRIIWKKDGAEMRLIPAGSFGMGDHFNQGRDPERPVHRVEQDAFYMDSYEVTVGQFKQFVEEGRYDYGRWDSVATYSPMDEHPIIFVTWHDATAYCEWAGKRLPTEAEWEYAARGGLKGKRHPWGNDEGQARDYANYDGTGGKDKWDRSTAPVGSLKPNGYGLFDMSGNVWEWCELLSISSVLRGGSWDNYASGLHVARRSSNGPVRIYGNVGFRCVSGSK